MPTQCDLYKKTLEEKFLDYHATNPGVYHAFVRYTEQLRNAGRVRSEGDRRADSVGQPRLRSRRQVQDQ